MTIGPERPGSTDFGLAGLEPATADDAIGARLLHHCGLDFDAQHGTRLGTSTYLGADADRYLAALITRNQRAGTYTVRVHRTDTAAEGRIWLTAQTAPPRTRTPARRAAALARGISTTPIAAAPSTAPTPGQPRTTARRR
ncbi:hypothetical protein KV557_00320 [Kitasatospora aureofaciens]|uniref:hypothetical protein n=1 Tax=Kitasatospora aureofaciens TaxID=1894 RepID=UPI001C47E2AB|nr:hypothetical protein [Kitasatospora aureofaciens]MBV6695571.1 hypothetical protein [Kitasatospora aureofaciens]